MASKILKRIMMMATAITLPIIAEAQEPADTISTLELNEIVIEAPKIIRKSDMDVYHPSKSAVENSKNGLQLLNNLMIPALNINDALGTIQAAGQAVQVRINGRESSIDQVRALLPETIKRVEWIDNPGLRYGGANYVVNFIVANPAFGGSLQVKAQPALNTAWGLFTGDMKLNAGRSQWEIGGYFKLTNRIKIHRDYAETFTYNDGTTLSRNEKPLGGVIDNSMANIRTSYNYIKPDTTIFMAEFGVYRNINERWVYNGLLSLSNGSEDILLNDTKGADGDTPSLSLYWQQHLRNKQMLVLSVNSSFYAGHSFSDYIEHPYVSKISEDAITGIHTDIKDRNQAYAIEADYIRNWRNSRFTAGVSYTANRNRSEYENMDGEIFHQHQDKVYLFAEYFRSFGRWTATAGMGMQYTEFLFKESGQGNHSWSPRPQATISYSLNQDHNIRLNFTSWQTAPSLAETNVVPQQLDGFQWRVGNQNLKTSNSYMLTLRYGYNFPRVNGSFGIRAFTSPNAITPILYWDENRLITSYENSRGLKNLSFFLAPQFEIIPEWLMASGYVQYRMERMSGTGYSLRNNTWSGNASIMLMHRGFVLSAQYVRAQRELWGEKITWGEDFNIIDLSYNWRSWQFGAGILIPFGNYDQGSKSLNKWNRNEQHMRINMRMPYISISYNLQWGRQKRGANKLIEVNANVDRSTAGER